MKTLFIVLSIFMITGCSEMDPSKLPTQMSEGVALHGNYRDYGSWIENTNKYPVCIRLVGGTAFGERTKAIRILEPGAKFTIDDRLRYHYDGFYIYTLDGVLVGWISCEPNTYL